MSKGENIFKRKDGRWEARYVKGYELSGKIKYGFCYGKTYREAKEKVTRAKAALLSGKPTPVTNSRHRFAWFCDQWFESSQSRFKESTCVKYKTILDKHIKPKLGGCFPLGFHDALIERFTNELLFEEELAPKTVKDILVVLRSILDYTAKRFPETFPRVDIVYPKEGRKEMRVLTREEQSTFLLAIALVGVRLVGLQVFTVLSGSMEPKSHPFSVSMTLYKGKKAVETVRLGKWNNWRYTWKGLSAKGDWHVVETKIPAGYVPSYSYWKGGVTVTNSKGLIQTGQLSWPIPVLGALGLALVAYGIFIIFIRTKKRKKNRE